MADLATRQRAFHAIVTGAAPLASARKLVDAGGVAPEDRMRVYAHAYVQRIREVIAADFPKVAAVLGDERFAAAVGMYLRAHPPRHWSLREAGDRLATFFAGDPAWPAWLADLARIERARVEAFDAGDAAPLSIAELARLPVEAFTELRLTLVPSAQLIPLAHPADDVWSAIEDGAGWATPLPSPRRVLVWRRDVTVVHRTLADDEAGLLAALAAGATFADACAACAAHPEPASRAFALVSTALDAGVLARTA